MLYRVKKVVRGAEYWLKEYGPSGGKHDWQGIKDNGSKMSHDDCRSWTDKLVVLYPGIELKIETA